MATFSGNIDELVIKIIMKKSFEEVAFPEEGLSLHIVIQNACASWEWEECKPDGAINYLIATPDNPSSYPVNEGYSKPNSDRKLNQYVAINQFISKDRPGGGSASLAPMSKCFWEQSTSSKHLARTSARWWIESTNQPRDSWSIAVDKTCLGVSEATDFAFSAFAFIGRDLVDQTPTSFFSDYESFIGGWRKTGTLDFYKRGTADSKADKNPQTCVEVSNASGFNQVTCADKREWEFTLCMNSSKSTLQILKNNKWFNFKTSKGVKKIAECPSDFYFHKFSSAYYVKKFDKVNKFSWWGKINEEEFLSKRKYRVTHGKPASYLDIKIESNDPYWDRND